MKNQCTALLVAHRRSGLRLRLFPVTGILITASMASQAVLAAENDRPLDEIIVHASKYVSTGGMSATKSNASLIETPQSVTVISRDQIDLLGWTSLQQSVRYTAGVTGENYGPDERYDWLTLRGFYPIQYIDGLQAPVSSVTNIGTDLFGFESVEILKGPSSVLYGQTPPGGIVNMTSRRPQREFSGEAGVQYGSYEHMQLQADVTGPLTDTLSYRMTALYRDRESQIDFMGAERTYVAPALTIDITDSTALTLLSYYQKDDVDNFSGGFLPAEGTLLPNPNGKIPVGFSTYEPGLNFFEREQWAIGYELSHEINESMSVQQNLKYFDVTGSQGGTYGQGFVDSNFDGTPDDFRTIHRSIFPFFEDVSSFNVDTRLAATVETGSVSHKLLAGFDYRKYEVASVFGFGFSQGFGGTVPTLDVFAPDYGQPLAQPEAIFPFQDIVQKQYGFYLQDQIAIDRLVLTLSGRHDKVDTVSGGSPSVSDNEFSYRAGLNYVFDSGFAPYAQAAKSFQPALGADAQGNRFEPTEGTQVEVGVKYDGRNLGPDLRIFSSIALFQLQQENVLTPDPDPVLAGQFFQVQTGEVEVTGLEFETVARFNERLSFNLSYTYTDSEVTKSNGPNLGKELMVVPKQKVSGLVDYTFQTGRLAGLGAGVGVRYLSEVYGDAANDWQTPGVTLYDGMVHYDTHDWKFALNASNMFDKTYVARCSSNIDCFYGTSRVVTASVTRKL